MDQNTNEINVLNNMDIKKKTISFIHSAIPWDRPELLIKCTVLCVEDWLINDRTTIYNRI